MLEDVNEIVEVITVFKKSKAWPRILKWNNRIYKIKNINMVHQVNDGRTLIHYFSVSDNLNFFKLAFNTSNLQWKLEQVYHEG